MNFSGILYNLYRHTAMLRKWNTCNFVFSVEVDFLREVHTRLLRFSSTSPKIWSGNRGLHSKYWSHGVLAGSESMCVKNKMIWIIIESHLEFDAKPVCTGNFHGLSTTWNFFVSYLGDENYRLHQTRQADSHVLSNFPASDGSPGKKDPH